MKNNKPFFYLRKVTIEDAILLFEWVNEKMVRTNSLNQIPISWKNHISWVNEKLHNSNCQMFILTDDKNTYGQIRIDYFNNKWEIDYSIDIKHRGKGYGKLIVKLLLEKFSNYNFIAIVKKNNISSINVFLNLSFSKIKNFDNYITFELNSK